VLSPALALVAIVLVLGVAAGAAHSVGRSGTSGEGQLRSDLRMVESSARFLSGLKLAKAQDLQQGFLDSYAAASRAHLESRVAFVRQVTVNRQFVALIGALAAVGAMFAAAAVTAASAATLIAFFVLLSRMIGPASQVLQGVQQVAHGLPVFEELRSLGAALARDCGWAAARAIPAAAPGPRAIVLEGVTLAHPAAAGEPRGGLESVTLAIQPGEFVGLAGPSGAGKTTLLDLVALVAAPDAGRVDFGAADVAGHRRRLAYLGAEPVLFADTVRVNLAWAAPGADDAAMWSALRKAGAEGLVRRLGRGLDGLLSEAGSNLSAGERQRIACARAFLRRPQLWLLDEATGSLDAAGERALVRRILAERPRPTVLFVTHRAESLALCERVVTLADGRLVTD
jgi:ATP-binding cassette subfamily C protein